MIRYVDWISNETLENVNPPSQLTKYINIGVHFSSNTKIRFKGYYMGYTNHTGAIGSVNSVSPNFSVFWYNNGGKIYADMNHSNASTTFTKEAGDFIDFTVTNRKVYDNVTSSYIIDSSAVAAFSNTTDYIYIDVETMRFQAIEVYENDVLVFDGHAAYDTVYGTIGVYDTLSQGMFVNNNLNIIKGADLSTIFVRAEKPNVGASGGTINVEISSEYSWSASSTGNWYTMSATAGTSADTAITITVPSSTASMQKEDTITFTNENNDTADLTIKQRKYSAGGIRLLDLGEEAVESFYIGGDEVETIYLGEEVVYQAGEFIGLKMKSNVSIATASGSTYDLKIKSSEPWTLSVDTAVTWLGFSQLTGGTGETIVTITTTEGNQTGSNRSTTITATTSSYTATCEVTQVYVQYVDYIHRSTLQDNVNNAYIDTGIYPTTATTFRVQGIGKGYTQGNIIVGYYYTDDNKDYRLFWYGGSQTLTFDFNNNRLENNNWGRPTDGRIIDLTCSNYGVVSADGTTYLTGNTQSTVADPHTILVDVGTWWFKSLVIWDNGVIVFNGQAAVDSQNNIVGIYDSISNTWKYNSALTMTTEEINMDLFSANVPQTQEYITEGSTTYYLYDKTQGYYEMESVEKVIGVLNKKYNGGQICVLKDVDNNYYYTLKYDKGSINIYSRGNLLTSLGNGNNTTINLLKITNYLGSNNQITFETTNAMWEIRQIASA